MKSTLLKAETGDADAQFALGLHYGQGNGAEPDLAQSARWYLKAAEQNHLLAQFNLGLMYAKGQGVAQDDAEAGRWMHRAAEQGDAGAQFQLGSRHHRASIKPQRADSAESRIESYKWFHLAAAQGYKDSVASCQLVTRGMTHAEVAEATQRAAKFTLVSE